MKRIKIILLVFLIIASSGLMGQQLSLNYAAGYNYLRQQQLLGEFDSTISLNLRPQAFNGLGQFSKDLVDNQYVSFSLLPVMIDAQYNGHHPIRKNDGSLVRAKGYQNRFSLGANAELGPLSIQYQPEFVYANNPEYPGFTSFHTEPDIKKRYSWWKGIDEPERQGTQPFSQFFNGQSSVLLNIWPVSIGLSSENVWWGPAKYNALILSNNSAGFNHYTLHTNKPANIGIGHIEGQIIGGRLEGSGFMPSQNEYDSLYAVPKDDWRYLSGITLTYSPKWVNGLSFGLNRVLQQYWEDAKARKDYLPIFNGLFKTQVNDDTLDRDQLLSVHWRYFNSKYQFEVYGEIGRNDAAQHLRDLYLQPGHSRAYIFGFSKIFSLRSTRLEAGFETSHLQRTTSHILRPEPMWYRHGQVRHGYTHQGDILGATSGVGSNQETVYLQLNISDWKWYRFTYQRTNMEADFTEVLVGKESSTRENRAIDHQMSFEANRSIGHFNLNGSLDFIRSKNYQWSGENKINLGLNLQVVYLW